MEETEVKYWSIGFVSELYSIPKSMIRYWITEFDLDIKQGSRDYYFFTWDQVQRIGEIKHLVKERRFTIEGAKFEIRPHNDRWEISNWLRVIH